MLPILGLAATAAGANWLFDRYGIATRAAVVRKVEWVTPGQNGGFFHSYSVTVRERGAPATEMVNHRTDRRFFDSLAIGDSISVRALAVRPSISRVEAMTAERWLGVVRDTGLLLFGGGVLAVFAGLFLFGGTGLSGSVRKAAALVRLAGGGFSCWREGSRTPGHRCPWKRPLPRELPSPASARCMRSTRFARAPAPAAAGA